MWYGLEFSLLSSCIKFILFCVGVFLPLSCWFWYGFLVIFSEFDMGSKFGLEVIFFFLMFVCISHYFFHYSIWDSLIFSIFSQCSSRINLISNFILKQIFLFIVVDFSLGCLILVDKKLRLWKRIDTLKPLSCFVVSRR